MFNIQNDQKSMPRAERTFPSSLQFEQAHNIAMLKMKQSTCVLISLLIMQNNQINLAQSNWYVIQKNSTHQSIIVKYKIIHILGQIQTC